jgi:hypothetical protein
MQNSVNNGSPDDFHFQDWELQIIFCMISLVFSFCSFYLFLYNRKSNSLLANILMLVCLGDAVSFYSLLIVICGIPNIIKDSKVNELLHWVTFQKMNPELHDKYNMTFIKINNAIFTSFLSLKIMFNIFYCWEIVCIFKYPISDTSKRKKFYFFFGFFIFKLSGLLTHLIFFDQVWNDMQSEVNFDKKVLLTIIKSQYFNMIILFFLLLFCIFSMYYVLKSLCSKSKFYSKARIFFSARHITYISIMISLWVYISIVLIVKDLPHLKVLMI